MIKLLTSYIAVLVAVFVFLAFADQGSNYVIEKKIWKLNEVKLDIAKDPAVVPSHVFEKAINGYQELIEKHPNSHLIPGLQIHIGEIYALRGDYEDARKIFAAIIESSENNKELAAEAMFKIGETHEVEGRWTEAYTNYYMVIEKYPLTGIGLNMPLRIADYYKGQNDFQSTMNAYETAIRHYTSIAKSERSKKAGLTAMRHLANCYLDQNRWKEAIDTLGSIIEEYSTSDYLTIKDVDLVIKTINITSAYQLKNYDVAIGLYENIISRNPDHPLNDYLKKVIDAFNQLKEKGIVVSEQ